MQTDWDQATSEQWLVYIGGGTLYHHNLIFLISQIFPTMYKLFDAALYGHFNHEVDMETILEDGEAYIS